MSEKMFNTRIIHKHDTAENWEKATGFIPMSGELVIYDVDENNKYARMKIGDGVTKISDLPFTKEIDSVPTSGSSNPVSSGGVFDALANKQDKLTFDSTPTENSSNPVTSGGIYTEVNSAKMAAGLAMPGSLKWDGIVGDRECIIVYEAPMGEGMSVRQAFVHISDYVPEILALIMAEIPAEERILPAVCSMGVNSMDTGGMHQIMPMQAQVADDMFIMGEGFAYVPTDGYSMEGLVFPKQGWYFIGFSGIMGDIETPLEYVSGLHIDMLNFPDTNGGGSDKYFEKKSETSVTELGDTLTWDGVSGKNIGASFGLFLVRMADCDLTPEELAAADITLTNSANNVGDIRVESVAGLTIAGDSNNDPYVFISYADNANLESIILPTKGIYFLNNGSVYCTSLTIAGYNFTNTTTTTQKIIKTEHLPEALRFGEITTEVHDDTLTWDGNTEGLANAVDVFYKVSDSTPTLTELNSETIVNFSNGSSYSNVVFSAGYDGIYAAQNPNGGPSCVVVVQESAAGVDVGGGLVFPESGTYFTLGIASFTINGYNGFVSKTTELVKIDPKYLPDGIGGGISSSEVDAKIEAAIGAAIAASY